MGLRVRLAPSWLLPPINLLFVSKPSTLMKRKSNYQSREQPGGCWYRPIGSWAVYWHIQCFEEFNYQLDANSNGVLASVTKTVYVAQVEPFCCFPNNGIFMCTLGERSKQRNLLIAYGASIANEAIIKHSRCCLQIKDLNPCNCSDGAVKDVWKWVEIVCLGCVWLQEMCVLVTYEASIAAVNEVMIKHAHTHIHTHPNLWGSSLGS